MHEGFVVSGKGIESWGTREGNIFSCDLSQKGTVFDAIFLDENVRWECGACFFFFGGRAGISWYIGEDLNGTCSSRLGLCSLHSACCFVPVL